MRRYKDKHGSSGVVAFQPGDDHIDVEFLDGKRYRYNEILPGKRDVDAMKLLAASGKGLATYINQHVGDRFAVRLR